MSVIENLFTRSPFTPLQTHMEKVSLCVGQLENLFREYSKQNYAAVKEIADQISESEHSADMTKNDIRNNLPRGLFLALNRSDLLTILSLQDSIADTAEDIGILVTLKNLKSTKEFMDKIDVFLKKNVDTVNETHNILKELEQLLQKTFSGKEAQQVKQMINNVAYMEHESDILQKGLLFYLYNMEEKIHFTDFHLWMNIIKAIASLGDISEKLANKISMIIETN